MTQPETFIAMQVSAETRRAYEQDMRRWMEFSQGGQMPEGTRGFELALLFRDWLAEKLAPASAARNWSTVRTYHRWLLAQQLIKSNPFDSLKGPKRTANRTPVVPSDDEVNALVRAADEHNPKWLAVICLLLNGLRAGEVGKLTMDDLHIAPDGNWMRVLGKGQKERLVPMTDEALEALRRYWHASGSHLLGGEDKAIVNDMGEQLTNKAVANIVYDCARKAKIKGMHPHSLRHHYATRLIKAGVSPLHVRDMLGHTSVATTQVYVTLDLTDLFEAARRDPRNPKYDGLRVIERKEATA